MFSKKFYLLRNFSGSEGQVLIDDKYVSIYPGDEIELEQCPTNHTANICISTFKRYYSGKPETTNTSETKTTANTSSTEKNAENNQEKTSTSSKKTEESKD